MSKLDELLRELCPNGVEYKKLGEIATISRGGNFQKKDFLTEGVPCIHYGQIYTKYGLFTDKTFTFISEECAKKQKMAQPNDIVMAVTSENIEDVCKCLAWLGDEPAAISGHSAIIHHNQNAKYLVYYFHSQMFFAQKRKLAHGTKVIEVTPDALVDITLPLPPIEVQREIVRILDNFTNLTAELTAELTARKTQYGYYRDKVLTPKDDVVVETLGNICRFVRGPFGGALKKEIFKPTGYAVYEQQHAIYRKLEFRYYIDKQKYEELKRFAVHPGEMIVSCSGTIGKTFVIPENAPEGVINQALLKLTPTSRINVFYLQYFFDNTISKILNSVARGGAIKNVPSVEELKAIIDKVGLNSQLGVCLDTCHVWDAGYDIVNDLDGVLEEFDRVIGLKRLKAIHINDSLNERGSHKDRHARIGEGKIGLPAFERIVRHPHLQGLPFILETPNDEEGWAKEIEMLRRASQDQ